MQLRAYLRDSKTSVTDFAERIGVARGTLHQYLNGQQFPRHHTLLRIREATDGHVTANDFVGAVIGAGDPITRSDGAAA